MGGASLSQYQATLPDGSTMELEILSNDNLRLDVATTPFLRKRAHTLTRTDRSMERSTGIR